MAQVHMWWFRHATAAWVNGEGDDDRMIACGHDHVSSCLWHERQKATGVRSLSQTCC